MDDDVAAFVMLEFLDDGDVRISADLPGEQAARDAIAGDLEELADDVRALSMGTVH